MSEEEQNTGVGTGAEATGETGEAAEGEQTQ